MNSKSMLTTIATTIQLMHSFEVNIRICQPENSNIHQGEAEVNITFEGLTHPDVHRKRKR